MSFTYSLTTDIGKVRLLIGDNVIASAQFSDAEIQVFLHLASGNIRVAAANALDAWAATLANAMKSENIGDYGYEKDSVANMKALAADLRAQAKAVPVFVWAEPDYEAIGDPEDD